MELVKGTGGRPPVVFPKEQTIELKALASKLTKEQLADYFGITVKTLRAVEKRQPEVLLAYQQGRAEMIYTVASALVDQALKGNVPAAMFYLRTQAGWNEKKAYDIQSDTDRSWTINVMGVSDRYQE